ncbi:type II toxin-antitoxin system RelE/ParE family toxin [Lactococcus termiticola]|uniref:Type II toxin-antitoxin system RelE/ParE family toxin n=1 Tax=Lactococcus termiticola TaxID=2169526 RepID=A0A2R5HIQ3_9LACT|nr:type II toxin-antitoxin system RelE/ParE family toxin [Lactococcus termiticola]GBG96248.1 hypothetical protein NtB2_00359 [Lactococcus termiticola]
MVYKLKYSPKFLEKTDAIFKQIIELSASESIARKIIAEIFLALEALSDFPEMGFDIDERLGISLLPPFVSRGMILGKFIAVYQLLDEKDEAGNGVVLISDIYPTQSDWVGYLKRRK